MAALSGRSSLIRHIRHICLRRVEQKTRFQREAKLLGKVWVIQDQNFTTDFSPPGRGEISQKVQIGWASTSTQCLWELWQRGTGSTALAKNRVSVLTLTYLTKFTGKIVHEIWPNYSFGWTSKGKFEEKNPFAKVGICLLPVWYRCIRICGWFFVDQARHKNKQHVWLGWGCIKINRAGVPAQTAVPWYGIDQLMGLSQWCMVDSRMDMWNVGWYDYVNLHHTHIYIYTLYILPSTYFDSFKIFIWPPQSLQYYVYKLYMTQVLRLLLAALTGREGLTIAVCLKDFRSSKVVGSLPQLW